MEEIGQAIRLAFVGVAALVLSGIAYSIVAATLLVLYLVG